MFHQGCIFCTPTAPQMEATALRLDSTGTVCVAMGLSGCVGLWGWGGGGQGEAAAAGGVALIEIVIIAVSKLQSFL